MEEIELARPDRSRKWGFPNFAFLKILSLKGRFFDRRFSLSLDRSWTGLRDRILAEGAKAWKKGIGRSGSFGENGRMSKRTVRSVFGLWLCFGLGLTAVWKQAQAQSGPIRPLPNVILCMADDLGWADTGFQGSRIVKTPHMDRIVRHGIRFTRWYSGAPVCSPTRGSCLTGRHPYRYGVFSANVGHMRPQEVTLAEALRAAGYTTGHFGKWHLGTLTTKVKDSNRGGPRNLKHYSPPWENGFDVCFSTEAKVPTWNPLERPKQFRPGESLRYGWVPRESPDEVTFYGTRYWVGPDQPIEHGLRGDDSKLIMDHALDFIQKAVQQRRPFFAVIWFHAPHLPVVTGKKYRDLYRDRPLQEQLYYGAISALDEQMGRLWDTLGRLGVRENTLLWFCSDNGPEVRTPGSPGPLRGRKRSLYEGGIRVPGFVVWPAVIRKPRTVDVPCSTSDYYPTVMDILGAYPKYQPRPIDGVSLLPLLQGKEWVRTKPIGFESGNQVALIGVRYKLYGVKPRGRKEYRYELYDLWADIGEKHDVSAQHPEILRKMIHQLEQWRASCRRSLAGEDYKKGGFSPED